MANVPAVFTNLTLEDQAIELRSYLKKIGAEISDDKSPKGVEDDLKTIISVCDACFKDTNEIDVENRLNSIVSMLVMIPPEKSSNLIGAFSEKLTRAPGPKLGHVALRVLWLLFQSLDEASSLRYNLYFHLIKVAQKIDQVSSIFKDVASFKKMFARAPVTPEQMQQLLRRLHRVLQIYKQNDLATKVMMELLNTYTDENAPQAKDDAKKCIVAALSDANTFLFDPLLALKPIQALQGELIYELLMIFVSGRLPSYLQFHKANKDVIAQLGFDHAQNLKKMKLLTFMQLAEVEKEISFETMQKELALPTDADVEAFVIEALRTKLVKARMDQLAKKVNISSTMHRSFDREHWVQLRNILQTWKINVHNIEETMKNLTLTRPSILSQKTTVA